MAQDPSKLLFEAPENEPRQMSKADFAKMMDVTPGYISQLMHKGLPVEPNGKIDPTKARTWWDANLVGGRKRRAGVQGTLASTKAQIDTERLEQLRIDTAVRRRDLVPREEARRAIIDRARAERDAHLSWAMREAPVLAAQLGVDPHAMFVALDTAMREHLAFLARTPLEELLSDG